MQQATATFGRDVLDWDGPFDDQGRQDRLDLPPGACQWSEDQSGETAGLHFVCPCGCGKTHAVTVNKGKKVEHAWEWNGDLEKPTLTPSIQCLSACRWHGYLTNGVFRPC